MSHHQILSESKILNSYTKINLITRLNFKLTLCKWHSEGRQFAICNQFIY